MNRRQKIIVSIVGIFIVLLALVGITYGYFLTRIQGNTNTTSISVTTADLKLVYGDGNQKVITGTNILPGTLIGEKDFTVSNQGNDTEYVVIIDGDNKLDNGINPITVTYASDGTNVENVPYNEGDITSFESNDFVYTLSCTSNIDGKTCNEKTLESTFPMNGAVIVGNTIEENEVHTYSLKVTYKNTDEDQSLDMNKKFNAIVNIMDIRSINPYSDNTDSLAYKIINNSIIAKNGTQLLATPLRNVTDEPDSSVVLENGIVKKIFLDMSSIEGYASNSDDAFNCADGEEWCTNDGVHGSPNSCADIENKYIITSLWQAFYVEGCENGLPYYTKKVESSLSPVQDDYGTSYYYRGAIEDNYVNFAGMCWLIVRVEGDGSTKLILKDQFAECNDNEDTDEDGTLDYKFTGNWEIGEGNYGYIEKNIDGEDVLIMNYLNPVIDKDNSMVKAFYDFQNLLAKKINTTLDESSTQTDINDALASKLKSGDWCLNDKAYTQTGSYPNYTYSPLEIYNHSTQMYYDSFIRLNVNNTNSNYPTLICNGTKLNKFANVEGVSDVSPMYVSTITAAEAILSGSELPYEEQYLLDYKLLEYDFITLSPAYYNSSDYIYSVSESIGVSEDLIHYDYPFRPMISLKTNTVSSSGTGTIDDPYVVKVS